MAATHEHGDQAAGAPAEERSRTAAGGRAPGARTPWLIAGVLAALAVLAAAWAGVMGAGAQPATGPLGQAEGVTPRAPLAIETPTVVDVERDAAEVDVAEAFRDFADALHSGDCPRLLASTTLEFQIWRLGGECTDEVDLIRASLVLEDIQEEGDYRIGTIDVAPGGGSARVMAATMDVLGEARWTTLLRADMVLEAGEWRVDAVDDGSTLEAEQSEPDYSALPEVALEPAWVVVTSNAALAAGDCRAAGELIGGGLMHTLGALPCHPRLSLLWSMADIEDHRVAVERVIVLPDRATVATVETFTYAGESGRSRCDYTLELLSGRWIVSTAECG